MAETVGGTTQQFAQGSPEAALTALRAAMRVQQAERLQQDQAVTANIQRMQQRPDVNAQQTMQATPTLTEPSVKEAAPTTSVSWRVADTDGNTALTIFSSDSTPRTQAEFTAALKDWQSGKEPVGYTFLEPGVMSTLRQQFAISSQGAQSVLGSLGKIAALPGRVAASAGETVGVLPQGSAAGVTQTGENVGRFIGKQTLGTPEAALTTATSIAGAPWVNKASGVLSMLRQAGLTGASQFAGKQAFAGQGDITKNAVESAMVAAVGAGTQGVIGALKGVFHLGVGEQAQREAAKQIVDKFKAANRTLTYDPVTLEAWASTPQGLRDIVQVGVGSLRGQVDSITGSVIADMNKRLPSRLSVGSQNTIRAQLRSLELAARDFLHATDTVGVDAAQQAIDTARNNIYNTVSAQFTAPSAKATLDSIMTTFNQRLDRFRVSARMLNLLRESGAGGGFNAAAFQRLVADKFMATGSGSFTADVGRAAFRGADPSAGTDIPVRGGFNIAKILGLENVPALRHLNVSLPLGNKYVGSIPGTYPRTTGAVQAVAIPTIKEYLQQEK